MRNLAVIQTENVRQYARNNGLEVVTSTHDQDVEFEIPPVRAILNGQPFLLPSLHLRNFGSMVVKLPEAIIRGRNLAAIHKNALLPSGYSHSFNWVEQGGFILSDEKTNCLWPSTPCVDIEGEPEIVVLGITSHFGHFFTDCLDRLLTIERIGPTTASRYMVDGALPIQVRQIVDLLGIHLPDSRLFIVNPALDYRVRNLQIVTLGSAKPAISISSFQALRERVLARLPDLPSNSRAIYVGRKGVQKRLILNQAEIEHHLSKLDFTAFYPEEHSFKEAAEIFRAANIVVIVIGSSKFNLALCQPGTLVICLAPEGYVEHSGAVAVMLRQLCALFQLELCFCSCKVSGENIGLDSDLIIDSRALDRALRALRA